MDETETKQVETEVVIFAKIGNMDGLQQANSQEHQLQLTTSLGKQNTCRVRRTSKDDAVEYTYTFKLKNATEGAVVPLQHEYNVAVTEDFFIGFKQVAEYAQDKIRYIFQSEKITLKYSENDEDKVIDVPDMIYEVDVFKKADGTFSEWCKIDIEIDKMMQYIDHNYPDIRDIKMSLKISHLPFEPKESFIGSENPERMDELYKNEYTTPLGTEPVAEAPAETTETVEPEPEDKSSEV